MLFKHKYLDLHLGLIKENFVVTEKENMKLWKARGFKKIRKYPIFHHKDMSGKVIMLGVPLNIEQFGAENLINSKIIDVSTLCGTYGMGGPGFFCLTLLGDYGTRCLTYCIWASGQHILFDDNILECHPNYAQQYHPIIDFDDYSNSLKKLKTMLMDMSIKDILLSDDKFEMQLTCSNGMIHTLKTYKFSDKFPEQGGTGKKRNSFETGEMKDYWLVTFNETHLRV